MDENTIARGVLDAAFRVHKTLGPGLLESVYEEILAHELRKAGLSVYQQVPVPLVWDGTVLRECFRADLVVEETLLVELKSVERLAPVHKKRVITYLKTTGMKLGLLINFGAPILRDGVGRVVNGFADRSSVERTGSVAPGSV